MLKYVATDSYPKGQLSMARKPRARDTLRQQSAIDFVVTYGWAFIIIAVALYAISASNVFNSGLVPPSCYAASSFSCGDISLSHNGILTVSLTQATGGTVTITGAGCATAANTTGQAPATGNTKIQSYTVASQYYPNSALSSGLVIYSGSTGILQVYCYGGAGGIYTTSVGSTVSGYLWINYTYTGLPTNYHTVQRVIGFTVPSS
jgi:hypothetical protein